LGREEYRRRERARGIGDMRGNGETGKTRNNVRSRKEFRERWERDKCGRGRE